MITRSAPAGGRAPAPGLTGEQVTMLGLCGLALLSCVLGLAIPPTAGSHEGLAQQVLDVGRVLSTTALAVVLILGPGVVWRASRGRPRLALGFLAVPGFALLVGTGAVAWALADRVSPSSVCLVVLVPVLGWLVAGVLRAGPGPLLEAEERRALVVVGCVLGIAIARTLWSLGPSGELYAGTISRTLEVGDRSDSKISYRVVQLVAHGTSPYGALGSALMRPYTFSDRGPLSGLASAPIVLMGGGRPPAATAAQPWAPFDAQGFVAYRLAMMTLAVTAFLSLWSVTRRLGGRRAARLALLLAATTPFLVHEVWFTWPKLLAASFVLLAALSLFDGRSLLAGLLVGAGYLVHPLALLSLPVLLLLALWPLAGARLRRPHVRSGVLVLGGAVAWLAAWRLVNWSHYTQGEFLRYFKQAGREGSLGGAATLSTWLSERLESLANTLVPLRLFVLSAHDPGINAVDPSCAPFCKADSPGVVHFFFQYWNTVPFGLAIVFFPLLLIALYRAARLWRWPVFAVVVVPFVAFTAYWGFTPSGMLREGLQAWVLTLVAVVALEQGRRSFPWLRSAPICLLLALRSVEVALVAVVPTLATRHRLYDPRFPLTDLLALLAMLCLCGCLGLLVWRERRGEQAQRPARSRTSGAVGAPTDALRPTTTLSSPSDSERRARVGSRRAVAAAPASGRLRSASPASQ